MSAPELPPEGTQLTKGRLDGLQVSPILGADGKVECLHFAIKDMPGLRIVVEAEACRELQTVLNLMFPP